MGEVSLNGGEGMMIGAVEPIIITADTPIDYDQWEDGKPWNLPKSSLPRGGHSERTSL